MRSMVPRVKSARFTLLPILALILSGAAALIYQSVWGRMLHLVFGVGDQAIATVLASFFLGLSLGSFLGGRIARRIASPAIAYAALEIFIAGWALLSIFLIPQIHGIYAAFSDGVGVAGLTTIRLVLSLAILLPPTIAMGATLPVLMRSETPGGVPWPALANKLYLANTLGAVIGAGLSGFYLLPLLGSRISLMLAALLSLLAALTLGVVQLRPSIIAEDGKKRRSPPLFLLLAGMTGMASLASEVLFTRVLRILVQGTTQAFASMLVAFLSGLFVGGVLAERLARRIPPARLLAIAQLSAGAFTLIAIGLIPQMIRTFPIILGGARLIPHEIKHLIAIGFLLLFPIALSLGASLPLLLRMAKDGEAHARTGGILGINTLGGLIGSLLAGFVLIPLPIIGGVENTLIGVAFIHLGLAAILVVFGEGLGRAFRFAAFALIIIAATAGALRPPQLHLAFLLDAWHDLNHTVFEGPEQDVREPVYLREGRNTTVTILNRGGTLRLFNDGRPESGFSYDYPGFGREVALLGAFPAFFAEKNDRALLIGLGGGHTATTLLTTGFDEVFVVELEEAILEAARILHDERNKHAERSIPFPLDRENARPIVDDARARLRLMPEGTLDAVVSQPSHPWLSGASALYTKEFFEVARGALREGGVLSIWVNLFRMDRGSLVDIIATLDAVFPHVMGFHPDESSLLFVASAAPLTTEDRLRPRLSANPEGGEILRALGLGGLDELLSFMELDPEAIRALALEGTVLVDDRPRLETSLAALPPSSELRAGDLDRLFQERPWMGEESREAHQARLYDLIERRARRVADRPIAIERLKRSIVPGSLDAQDEALLRGLIAEIEGDIEGAKAHYIASESALGETRHDELLYRLGDYAAILERRAEAAIWPDDLAPAILAAMELDERELLSSFVEMLSEDSGEENLTHRAIARAAQARLGEDCATIIGIAESREELILARIAAECAASAGDPNLAADLLRRAHVINEERASDLRLLAQRAESVNATARAIRLNREALRLAPGHPKIAIPLLEQLVVAGREEEARALYLKALRDARYRSPRAEAELLGLGKRLELEKEAKDSAR